MKSFGSTLGDENGIRVLNLLCEFESLFLPLREALLECCLGEDPLALVPDEDVETLETLDDVLRRDARHPTQLLD